jgi:hypothetical protein
VEHRLAEPAVLVRLAKEARAELRQDQTAALVVEAVLPL